MIGLLCGAPLQNSSWTGLQKHDPFYSALIANIVINGFLCYTNIMMNIVTIHALRKTSSLPKLLKTLLLSLAVSDVCAGLLSQPLNIAFQAQILRCNFDVIVGASLVVISNFLYLSSLFSITALSADRFVAIQMPLRYQVLVTYRRVVIVVIAIWLFSAFFGLIDFFLIPDDVSFAIHFTIESLCFVATTCFSFKVYLTAKRHKLQLQAQTQRDVENIARHRKTALSAFWIYLAFWVCYLPNFFVYCFYHLTPGRQSIIISTLETCSATLVHLNSSLNPVIYSWKMSHIRRTILNSLRGIIRR